jgi:tRNA1(Val) A37 N6-methylase TrmN6
MSDEGQAFLVLPVFNVDIFEEIALRAGLFVTQKAEVTAVKGKQPYVVLLKLEKVQNETILQRSIYTKQTALSRISIGQLPKTST